MRNITIAAGMFATLAFGLPSKAFADVKNADVRCYSGDRLVYSADSAYFVIEGSGYIRVYKTDTTREPDLIMGAICVVTPIT